MEQKQFKVRQCSLPLESVLALPRRCEESHAYSLERNIRGIYSSQLPMALAIQDKILSTFFFFFGGFPRVNLYVSLDGCLSPCCACTPLLLFTDSPGPSQPHSVLLPVSLPSRAGDISISCLFHIAGCKPMSSLTSLGGLLGARVYRIPACHYYSSFRVFNQV